MADDYIQVATDGTGKKVGNQTVIRGTDTIYLQEVVVCRADGTIIDPATKVPPLTFPEVQVVRPEGAVPVTMQRATLTMAAAFTVSTTAVRLASVNASRLSLIIANNGSGSLYVGPTSAVTASGIGMGLKVPSGGRYSDTDNGVSVGEVWGIYSVAATTQNVSVQDRS